MKLIKPDLCSEMKTQSNHIEKAIKIYLWGLISVLMLQACHKDTLNIEKFSNVDCGDSVKVSLGLKFAAEEQGQSVQYSAKYSNFINEDVIKVLDLFAFEVLDNGQEVFAFHSYIQSVNDARMPEVTLKKSDRRYSFIVIANADEKLRFTFAAIPLRLEKTQVMDRFILTVENNSPLTRGGTAIPMYGFSQIVEGINLYSRIYVRLIRGLARLDLKLSGNAKRDFVITSVDLRLSSSSARLIPLKGDDGLNSKSVQDELSSRIYNFSNGLSSVLNEIYLYDQFNRDRPLVLLIGMKNLKNAELVYFRLDLVDADQGGIKVDQNKSYIVNITDIKTAGFPDKAAAWRAIPIRANLEVRAWNTASIDGQVKRELRLSLAVSTMRVSNAGETLDLPLIALHNQNLSVYSTDDWIDVTLANAYYSVYRIKVNANRKYPKVMRSGTITIDLNGTKKVVSVIQDEIPTHIKVDDKLMIYHRDLPLSDWNTYSNAKIGIDIKGDEVNQPAFQNDIPVEGSCANLGKGWRLPTVNEILKIFPEQDNKMKQENVLKLEKSGMGLRVIDQFFKANGIPSSGSYYYTSTVSNEKTDNIYHYNSLFSVGIGEGYGLAKHETYVWARCVKSLTN